MTPDGTERPEIPPDLLNEVRAETNEHGHVRYCPECGIPIKLSHTCWACWPIWYRRNYPRSKSPVYKSGNISQTGFSRNLDQRLVSLWEDRTSSKVDTPAQRPCTCPMLTLLREGCKCGAIKRYRP
jgi:hypothetical protein